MYKSFKDKLKTEQALKNDVNKKEKVKEKDEINIDDILNDDKKRVKKEIPKYDINEELDYEEKRGILPLNVIKELNTTED